MSTETLDKSAKLPYGLSEQQFKQLSPTAQASLLLDPPESGEIDTESAPTETSETPAEISQRLVDEMGLEKSKVVSAIHGAIHENNSNSLYVEHGQRGPISSFAFTEAGKHFVESQIELVLNET